MRLNSFNLSEQNKKKEKEYVEELVQEKVRPEEEG